MARPKKDNADYFSHDADMRNDNKIKAVRRKYGLTGYAIWCMMLEHLTNENHFRYELSDLNLELLAGDFDIEPDKLHEIIDYFIRLRLINQEEEFIYSDQHIKRFEALLNKRNRDIKPKSKELSTSKTPQLGINDSENPHSKVKESKVKETKDIESRKMEFKKLLSPFKNKYSIELLKEFYQYWTEHGINDKKMRFEKEKSYSIGRRLGTWKKKESIFNRKPEVDKNGFKIVDIKI